MEINIPCPGCGCQTCLAENLKGEKCVIEVCTCNDGSNEYEVTLNWIEKDEKNYEKHQCMKSELQNCLKNRFNIDLSKITYSCC